MKDERDIIQNGDEVMFVGIREHYEDPFHTPEVGARGVVMSKKIMANGVFGWLVKWYDFGESVCHENVLTITNKYAALPFKVGDTVVAKKNTRFASAGTFGKVVGVNERFYGVAFENCKMWYCSEDEIAKPTESEINLRNEIQRLRGLMKCQE